jgi:hypothetical protein
MIKISLVLFWIIVAMLVISIAPSWILVVSLIIAVFLVLMKRDFPCRFAFLRSAERASASGGNVVLIC